MYKYILILMFVYTLCGCHTTYKTTAVKPNVPNKTGSYLANNHILTDMEISEIQKFMGAEKSYILGDAQQALNLYEEVVKMDPANDAAWYQISRLHLKGYRYPLALSAAATAYHLDGNNKWYAEQLANCYAVQSKFKDAAAVYASYLDKHPDNEELYYEWALILQQAKDLNGAIAVYNKLEKLTGVDENEINEKQRLYLQMGKPDKAAAEVQKLCDAYPNNPDYLGMLADIYSTSGNYTKAIETVQHIIEISPMNDKAYFVLSLYYKQMGNEAQSQAILKKTFANAQLSPDNKVRWLNNQPETKKMTDTLINILKVTHPDNPNVHEYVALYLEAKGQDSLAYSEFRSASKLNSKSGTVWEQLIQYNLYKGHKDSSIYYIRQYINLFPHNIDAYYSIGIAYQQLKQYDSSIAYLNKGIAIGSDNKKLMASLYSNMGESYHSEASFSKSDSAYETALTFDPDDALTLNNYAYYLSLRNKDLDKAAGMSRKSNFIDPNEPSFLDTYGWILYKQDKLDEAKEYLKKAIDKGGIKHADILEHYGDVLYKSGDIDNAVEYWKKARALNPDDAPLLDKKITDKKSYE